MTLGALSGLGLLSGAEGPHAAHTDGLPRIVIIAIDGLNPRNVEMNADASGPGSPGNWLMPNVRKFVEAGLFWPNAVGSAPHTTDSNHFAALSAVPASRSGIVGVVSQDEQWQAQGLTKGAVHVSKTRGPDGAPRVKTLFDLLKQRTGGAARTAMLSNKGWIVDMFRDTPATPLPDPPVDILIHGSSYPAYIQPPVSDPRHWWDNPLTDPDAACDPESPAQTFHLANTSIGQPENHPRDSWITDAALAVVDQESPDMMYVVLADLDHVQHFLGSVDDPAEWVAEGDPPVRPGCTIEPHYRLVSSRNRLLFKEPILDLMREVDNAFGRLVYGMLVRGYIDQNTRIFLISDHSMVNHLYTPEIETLTDIPAILGEAGLTPPESFSLGGGGPLVHLTWRPFYKAYVQPDVIARAVAALTDPARRLVNPQTGALELPWDVVTRAEMAWGKAEIGLPPGMLYHPHIIKVANTPTLPQYAGESWKAWPDIFVMMRNGWESYGQYPALNAGHGAPDTAQVMLSAVGFPAQGIVCDDNVRLTDVALTAAYVLGVTFPHSTQGAAAPLVCRHPR